MKQFHLAVARIWPGALMLACFCLISNAYNLCTDGLIFQEFEETERQVSAYSFVLDKFLCSYALLIFNTCVLIGS